MAVKPRYGLLINSELSDTFSLGVSEEAIPDDVQHRIIKYSTKFAGNYREDMKAHFRTYSNIKTAQGMPTCAIGEFCLERFFEKVGRKGDFSSIEFFHGDPEHPYEAGGLLYTFTDGGKVIKAYDAESMIGVATIRRLVEIRRNKERQVIICEGRAGRDHKTTFISKIRAVRPLLGERYTLSFLKSYPSDIFRKNLNTRYENVLDFLCYNVANLVLVFSGVSQNFEKAGKSILDEISSEDNLHQPFQGKFQNE